MNKAFLVSDFNILFAREHLYLMLLNRLRRDALSVADRVRCPTLILHSNDDQIVGVRHGIA